ncbi:hypothetical protein HNV11_03290 [Spirosoma taeanense]|uniref:Uncharacterized protein n=2 Tax=Spirosoma taeanense TaxID=2735870 RepID=A0A6M5YG34_9BACT|nr:hypothetical protein HNV11_03290 [Spirosoma taeanense]
MWRLRECRLNDEQLSSAIGVRSSAVRSRRAKPDLWKLSDIERLATYFRVPTTACLQLNATLHDLPTRLSELTTAERRQLERILPVKKTQLHAYNVTGWPVRHLLQMHQALGTLPHE